MTSSKVITSEHFEGNLPGLTHTATRIKTPLFALIAHGFNGLNFGSMVSVSLNSEDKYLVLTF